MAFLNYLFQVSICMTFFYAAYYLLLRRLTFFAWSRFFLLFSLMGSMVIPLIQIPVTVSGQSVSAHFISAWQIEERTSIAVQQVDTGTGWSWSMIVLVVYMAGAAMTLFQLARSLQVIYKVYRKKEIERRGSIRIVKGVPPINNCSFLDTIFIVPEWLTSQECEQVILHEECHIYHRHTYDKLLVHLVQVFFWFHPFVYFFRHSLEVVHEYEVDAQLVTQMDKRNYAHLLLRISVNNQLPQVNGFSSASLKARIRMLFQPKSSKLKAVYYFIGIPVVLLGLLSFSIKDMGDLNLKDRIRQSWVTTPPVATTADNRPEANILKKRDIEHAQSERYQQKIRTPITSPDKSISSRMAEGGIIRQKVTAQHIPTFNSRNDSAARMEAANVIPEEEPFFSRTTLINKDGVEFDQLRMHFGEKYLTGNIFKGGKILFIIGGVHYEESDLKTLNPDHIGNLKGGCRIQIRTGAQSLYYGKYDGIVEIGI